MVAAVATDEPQMEPKAALANYGSHGQSALEAAHDAGRKLEQGLADTALRGEIAHQDEQRNDREVVTGKTCKGERVEKTGKRRPAALQDVAKGARAEHGDGNRALEWPSTPA